MYSALGWEVIKTMLLLYESLSEKSIMDSGEVDYYILKPNHRKVSAILGKKSSCDEA